jgi:transcriptional regulator GlxA family with amidase domain
MAHDARPLIFDIYWCPEAVLGGALAAVDLLRGIQALAAMRSPEHRTPVTWRWFTANSMKLATGLPKPLAPAGSGVTRRTPCDVVILPGWHATSGPHLEQLARRDMAVGDYARAIHLAGGHVVSLYNASAVLGLCGMLNGKEVSAPWAYLTSMLRLSTGMQPLSDQGWCQSDRIWTCDSPILATQVCIALLQTTRIARLATSASHVLVHSAQRQQVTAHIVRDALTRQSSIGAVEYARQWLEEHLCEPYDLKALAKVASTSPRTLLRHFFAEHDCTPMDYLRQLRIARACVLLETTYLSIEQIGQACGYPHVSSFRRIFITVTKEQPAAYRASYRLRATRKRWGRNIPKILATDGYIKIKD